MKDTVKFTKAEARAFIRSRLEGNEGDILSTELGLERSLRHSFTRTKRIVTKHLRDQLLNEGMDT